MKGRTPRDSSSTYVYKICVYDDRFNESTDRLFCIIVMGMHTHMFYTLGVCNVV
jgi:hypothetical protein